MKSAGTVKRQTAPREDTGPKFMEQVEKLWDYDIILDRELYPRRFASRRREVLADIRSRWINRHINCQLKRKG